MSPEEEFNQVIEPGAQIMFKRTADLIDDKGTVVAAFNETCHEYRSTVATVRLRAPLAPFLLQGTESLAIFAKGSSLPVISVEASDPAGTEIREFHGISAVGCIPEGTGIALVKNPGGDLGTLLVVLGTGTVEPQS
jgi:hypothetical protein